MKSRKQQKQNVIRRMNLQAKKKYPKDSDMNATGDFWRFSFNKVMPQEINENDNSHWKNISWSQLFSNFFSAHTVEKREILSHQKFFSSNQLFSNLFSKTVTFTEFLPKMHEREFP